VGEASRRAEESLTFQISGIVNVNRVQRREETAVRAIAREAKTLKFC